MLASEATEPVGMLVLADVALREGLAEADLVDLLDLEPALAAELGMHGRAGLQAMAGAVESTDASWRGELLYSNACSE